MSGLLRLVVAMVLSCVAACGGGNRKPAPDAGPAEVLEVSEVGDAAELSDLAPDAEVADLRGDPAGDAGGDAVGEAVDLGDAPEDAADAGGDADGDTAGDACDLVLPEVLPDTADVSGDATDLVVPDMPTDNAEVAGDEKDAVLPQPCELDFDCDPGQSCVLGLCKQFEPECAKDDECGQDETCVEGICLSGGMSPQAGTLIFNEVLADGDVDGDPNQDGTGDPTEDEFVELVNIGSSPLDVGGWLLVETDWAEWLPRYTFPQGMVIAPKMAVVIFGGGNAPDSTAAVFIDTSNAEDPGIPFGLDLDDAGDMIRLLDANGLTVAVFAYGDAGGTPATSDMSLTRSPDLTGPFTPHILAEGADDAIFSPGTRVDGTPF